MAQSVGFNVNGFASNIAKYGLASPNKFKVTINSKMAITGARAESTSGTDIGIALMCESVSLAGRSIQSIMDLRYGQRREIAYNAPVYPPINLTFLCSEDYREKDFFDRWNNSIVNSSNGFDVAYYDNYTGSMEIETLTREGKSGGLGRKSTYKMTYHEAYPKDVTAIELSHSTQNSTAKFTVTMNYSKWTTDSIPIQQ